MYALKK